MLHFNLNENLFAITLLTHVLRAVHMIKLIKAAIWYRRWILAKIVLKGENWTIISVENPFVFTWMLNRELNFYDSAHSLFFFLIWGWNCKKSHLWMSCTVLFLSIGSITWPISRLKSQFPHHTIYRLENSALNIMLLRVWAI